jgi:hypothetical protein
MMMSQPDVYTTFSQPEEMMFSQPDVYTTFSQPEEMMMSQPSVYTTFSQPEEMMFSQPDVYTTFSQPEEMMFSQPEEMIFSQPADNLNTSYAPVFSEEAINLVQPENNIYKNIINESINLNERRPIDYINSILPNKNKNNNIYNDVNIDDTNLNPTSLLGLSNIDNIFSTSTPTYKMDFLPYIENISQMYDSF